jgi:probable HAF family extracellular repeat protein
MWQRVVVAALVLSASAARGAPRYRAVELPISGDSVTPVAVNDAGVVAVSWYDVEAGTSRSALYDLGRGAVVHAFPAGDTVEALSEAGNAAGTSTMTSWLFRDGVRTEIPLRPLDVNDRGQVVGFVGGFFVRAALYDAERGTLTELGAAPQSAAFAIDAAGQVVGWSVDGGAPRAFRFRRGVMEDLGTLGGETSFAYDVNAPGRIVGSADTGTALHAFLWTDGQMLDLGTLPGCERSEAGAMSARGEIVGSSDLCEAGGTRAFRWHRGEMADLNDLAPPRADGFLYAVPTGVNAAGTIVGVAVSPDGFSTRPFVLVPVGDGG